MKVLKIYPLPGREVSTTYEDLDLPLAGRHGVGRPFVVLNMINSLDGKTAIKGRAAGIGSRIDRKTMRTLRSKVDAVMIGAGTLRAERLSLGLDASSHASQPLAIIVTDTGDVPLKEHLVVPKGQEVLVLLSDAAPSKAVERLGKLALVMKAPADPTGAVDLNAALRILQAEHGVETIVVEGGPSLNHALISHDLVDELFLTVAPELLGGSADQTLTLLKGPELTIRPTLELLSIYSAGSELFLRYSLIRTPPYSA